MLRYMDTEVGLAWLLLVVTLPTHGATARMRIWRALKARGCAALRDGAYLLPAGSEREEALQELAVDCESEGGSAWLMSVMPRSEEEQKLFRELFDRRDDYAALRKNWNQANRTLASLAPNELARLQRKMQRDYEAVRSIDFFASDASLEAHAAWTD